VVAAVAGVAFFVMSVALLGVWPGRVLDRQVRAMSPERALGLTVSEERGRTIYGREGCAYCHTQQIRFVHADIRRFGAPTLAWETRIRFPSPLGHTADRAGPGARGIREDRRLALAHLFAPRSVVTDSVMPSYAGCSTAVPIDLCRACAIWWSICNRSDAHASLPDPTVRRAHANAATAPATT
jgi:cytochrome c oxidase cbb3-type subunit 2/cytochrome c oxidase cbb3-type subunit I/II